MNSVSKHLASSSSLQVQNSVFIGLSYCKGSSEFRITFTLIFKLALKLFIVRIKNTHNKQFVSASDQKVTKSRQSFLFGILIWSPCTTHSKTKTND